jgi:hypothetical protein
LVPFPLPPISTGRASFRLICPSSDFAVPTRPPAFALVV